MEKTIGFGTMTKETRDGFTGVEITGYTGYTLREETYGDITADDVIASYQREGNDRESGEHHPYLMPPESGNPKFTVSGSS